MKKAKFLSLSLILLAGVTLFTGCGSTNYFSVSTRASKNDYGSTNGSLDSTWAEGTTLNLIATSFDENEHPFICWVKDGSKICSTESKFSLVVKEDGIYTAVFDEDANSMMYASLTNLTYNTEDFSKINYTVRYAPLNNVDRPSVHCEGESEEMSTNTFTDNVFCLSENSQPKAYIFSVEIVVTNSAGTGASTYQFRDINVTNSSFNGNSEFVYERDGLSLTFSKLSKDLFN